MIFGQPWNMYSVIGGVYQSLQHWQDTNQYGQHDVMVTILISDKLFNRATASTMITLTISLYTSDIYCESYSGT